MARAINFQFDSEEIALSPVKVDRNKLYGWTDIRTLDSNGDQCQTAWLDRSGTLLIPKGGLSTGMLSPSGNWVARSELIAANAEGQPAPLIPSTFSVPVRLDQIASIEDVLDHSIDTVYQLEGEAGNLLERCMKGEIYKFAFNFRDAYESDIAFLLESKGSLFILAGKAQEFNYLSMEETSIVSDDETNDEVESDDIDFSMM